MVVSVSERGAGPVAGIELVGERVHVGDLASQGVHDHVRQRDIAAQRVHVRAVQAGMPVDPRGGEQHPARPAGRVKHGAAFRGVTHGNRGHQVRDRVRGEELALPPLRYQPLEQRAQRVPEILGALPGLGQHGQHGLPPGIPRECGEGGRPGFGRPVQPERQEEEVQQSAEGGGVVIVMGIALEQRNELGNVCHIELCFVDSGKVSHGLPPRGRGCPSPLSENHAIRYL